MNQGRAGVHSASWHPKDKMLVLLWNVAVRLDELQAKANDRIQVVTPELTEIGTIRSNICALCTSYKDTSSRMHTHARHAARRCALSSLQLCQADFHIPTLQIRKVRQGKATELIQGHTTGMLLSGNGTDHFMDKTPNFNWPHGYLG
jgi:hypothetical protein